MIRGPDCWVSRTKHCTKGGGSNSRKKGVSSGHEGRRVEGSSRAGQSSAFGDTAPPFALTHGVFSSVHVVRGQAGLIKTVLKHPFSPPHRLRRTCGFLERPGQLSHWGWSMEWTWGRCSSSLLSHPLYNTAREYTKGLPTTMWEYRHTHRPDMHTHAYISSFYTCSYIWGFRSIHTHIYPPFPCVRAGIFQGANLYPFWCGGWSLAHTQKYTGVTPSGVLGTLHGAGDGIGVSHMQDKHLNLYTVFLWIGDQMVS